MRGSRSFCSERRVLTNAFQLGNGAFCIDLAARVRRVLHRQCSCLGRDHGLVGINRSKKATISFFRLVTLGNAHEAIPHHETDSGRQ